MSSRQSQQKDLLISGYVRDGTIESVIGRIIPNEILLVIAMFYPIYIEFEGSSIKLTVDEKEMITSWLNEQILEVWNKTVTYIMNI